MEGSGTLDPWIFGMSVLRYAEFVGIWKGQKGSWLVDVIRVDGYLMISTHKVQLWKDGGTLQRTPEIMYVWHGTLVGNGVSIQCTIITTGASSLLGDAQALKEGHMMPRCSIVLQLWGLQVFHINKESEMLKKIGSKNWSLYVSNNENPGKRSMEPKSRVSDCLPKVGIGVLVCQVRGGEWRERGMTLTSEPVSMRKTCVIIKGDLYIGQSHPSPRAVSITVPYTSEPQRRTWHDTSWLGGGVFEGGRVLEGVRIRQWDMEARSRETSSHSSLTSESSRCVVHIVGVHDLVRHVVEGCGGVSSMEHQMRQKHCHVETDNQLLIIDFWFCRFEF